ncbi:hypothetical protein GGR57DRAFT_1057 [Xylariaceae sp. FL1272]|nr:hypothetical protein GGR57DRAFT_1057 [Xylariaceae sp. FL1272]
MVAESVNPIKLKLLQGFYFISLVTTGRHVWRCHKTACKPSGKYLTSQVSCQGVYARTGNICNGEGLLIPSQPRDMAYHQISSLNIPSPFRNTERQPDPDTPLRTLLAAGHFRASAIAAAQELTGSSPAVPPGQSINPTDYTRIFRLFYVRLSCLCLIDAVPLAAQEAKALEDLNSAIYTDPETGIHLAPWELRILAVRLQTIGFGDPRRAVMIYYELAREARSEVMRAGKAHDHSAAEKWKTRLGRIGNQSC